MLRFLVAIAGALLLTAPGAAREWRVPRDGRLTEVLAGLEDGDRVEVAGGIHRGPLVLDRSVEMVGIGRPVLEGGGAGTVVTITAPAVTVRGFVVRGSGASLDEENSGIAIEAPGAVIEDNHLEEVLFGVYARKAPGTRISGNRIHGMDLDLARRGDAIRVWYSDGVEISDNVVEAARDVVLWYSKRLTVRGNEVRNGRYGLHFMYCDDARIEGNRLEGNSVGAFLMYSRRLELSHNVLAGNRGPSGYGVGLKDMDDSRVVANLFAGNRVGAYLDNSPRESGSSTVLEGNVLLANGVGVSMLPNVARARFSGNDFVENTEQVGLAGQGGDPDANVWVGNYWSDYVGYDADADGTGDVPYRSDRLFESLADRRPELRVFATSPAAAALDFAARALPLVRPQPKLVDHSPRVRPVAAASVPVRTAGAGGPWAPVAALLLVFGSLAAAAPAWGRRGRRTVVGAGDRAAVAGRSVTIRVRGLEVAFGETRVLDGLDLDVPAGGSLALWGDNGAGKTTALRALLGLLPFAGTIEVGGLDPARHGKQVRRLAGLVPQDVQLAGEPTVEETLAFFARLRRVRADRAIELTGWLGLSEHRSKRVRELSGGLRQRLALGIALLDDPPLLLLDEPTANLDAGGRESFYGLLDELSASSKTIVFTTHRASEVRRLADRVLALDGRGRGVEMDPADLGRRTFELAFEVAFESAPAALRALDARGVEGRWSHGWLKVPRAEDEREATAALAGAGIEISGCRLEGEGDDA